jgi:hypothetical protein
MSSLEDNIALFEAAYDHVLNSHQNFSMDNRIDVANHLSLMTKTDEVCERIVAVAEDAMNLLDDMSVALGELRDHMEGIVEAVENTELVDAVGDLSNELSDLRTVVENVGK